MNVNDAGAALVVMALLFAVPFALICVWLKGQEQRATRCATPTCYNLTLDGDHCGPCTAAIARSKTRAMQAFRDHWGQK